MRITPVQSFCSSTPPKRFRPKPWPFVKGGLLLVNGPRCAVIASVGQPQNTVGQVVFMRTDVPDYVEETFTFGSLEELIALCTTPKPNLTLEKVMVYAMAGETPISLTLGFVAASKGRRLPEEILKQVEGR